MTWDKRNFEENTFMFDFETHIQDALDEHGLSDLDGKLSCEPGLILIYSMKKLINVTIFLSKLG